MSTKEEREEYLQKAMAYCSRAEHCKSEVMEKLYRWQVPSSDKAYIVDRLCEEGFIDESRYVRAYADDKYRLAGWGRRKILLMLQQKRIPRKVAEPLLDEVIDEEVYCDVLLGLLRQKRQQLGGGDDAATQGKLARFAMARGYLWPEIKQALCAMDMELEISEVDDADVEIEE